MALNHLLRRLRRSPMFAVVTLATLAIGIGANTAIFSVVNGILLKPLAYPHAEQLLSIDHSALGLKMERTGEAPFLYFILREQNRTFQDIGTWTGDSIAIVGRGEPQKVDGVDITDGVLPVLGVQPAIGRLFNRTDVTPGSPETVILSYAWWQSHFGGDRSAVGQTLLAGGVPRTIIGVLPASFRFLDIKPDLFLPLRFDRAKTYLGNFSYRAIGRLKPGVTLAQAAADEARLFPVALDSFPPYPGYNKGMFQEAHLQPNFRPLKQEVVGDIGNVLWLLMATIGMVLLIACANVANLLLVRTEGRQQELAVRAALGAGWGAIARELMTESLLLGLAGGALGFGLAYGAVRWLVATAPANLPRLSEISLNGRVVLFTLAASLLAGLLFGAIPVFKYAGPHLATTLRSGGRSLSYSKERHRARSTLVVVQVALAMLLLIGSGLMIRTFRALRQVQPGFTNPEQIQTVQLYIQETQIKDPLQTIHTEQNILDKIAALPEVRSVASSSFIPMDGTNWHDPIYADDQSYRDSQLPPLRAFRMTSPGLLQTVGNRLIVGRDFTWTDIYDTRPVAMVSENLARELWHDPARALGRRIRESMKAPWREIVGVAADSLDDGVSQPAPTVVYWPLLMRNFASNELNVQRGMSIVIRSSRTGSVGFVHQIGQAIWSVNPDIPLANVRTLQTVYDHSMARTSFTLVMLAMAGAMAMLLGLVGIYGVISYSVSQRTREIGLRMALGSPQSDVTRLFVAHGLRLSLIGVGAGLAAALICTRAMKAVLFGTSPLDPVTYAGVALGLIAAALLASYLPALRATRIDPTEALRAE